MIESTKGIGNQSEECPPNSPELVILLVTSKSKRRYTMTDSSSAYDQKSGPGDRFPQPLPPSELQSLDLEKVDIPSYVCYHQIMLTFPAKVCKLSVCTHSPAEKVKNPLTLKYAVSNKLMLITMHIEKMEKVARGSTGGVPPVQWGNSETDSDIIVFNDPDRFAAKVLPIFAFPKTSFKSFVRKMYRWGFRRAQPNESAMSNRSSAPWAFFCDNFRRGDFLRLMRMVSIDSRPKKGARGSTPLLATSMNPSAITATRTGTSSMNTGGPTGEVQGRLDVRQKKRPRLPGDTVHSDSESMSVAESSRSNVSTAGTAESSTNGSRSNRGRKRARVPKGSISPRQSKPAAAAQALLPTEAASVCYQPSGRGEVSDDSRPLEPEIRVSTRERMSTDANSHMASLSSSSHYLQAVLPSRITASDQINSATSYLATQQMAASRLAASELQRNTYLPPDRPEHAFPPHAASLLSRSVTGNAHALQSHMLSAAQYPVQLGINRDLGSYQRLLENFNLNNTLMPTNTGVPLPSTVSPSLLLGTLAQPGSMHSNLLATAYLHRQQQVQRALLQMAAGPQSVAPVTNSLMIPNPLGSATFPAGHPPAAGSASASISPDLLRLLTPEQLLALFRAQQGG
jgi:HSF-type DNA-binding